MRGVTRQASIILLTSMGFLALMIGTNFVARGEEADNIDVEMNQMGAVNNDGSMVNDPSVILVAPTELEVEVVTGRSISLKWHPVGESNSNVTYEVYESGNLVAETDVSSYVAEDLSAGKEYIFYVRAKQGNMVSALSNSIRSTTYGEILQNGTLLELEEHKNSIRFWQDYHDQIETSYKIVTSPVDGKTNVLGINLSGSKQSKTVLLSQEARVDGKQFYMGSGQAQVDSSSLVGKVNWEIQFLNESGDVLMESELTNHVTGETPEGTTSVRVQLVIGEKLDEEPMTIYVDSVSVSIESEIHEIAKMDSQVANPVTYKYQYDANGRLTIVEMNENSIQYLYDAKGNLIEKIKK